MATGLLGTAESWDEEDVRNLYRLALRREAEAEATVEAMAKLGRDQVLRTFFNSPEFMQSLRPAFERGERPWRDERGGPSLELREWAAARFPLTELGRHEFLQAVSWARAYWLLLSDPDFAQVVGPRVLGGPDEMERLEEFATFDGRVEQVDGRVMTGWAMRLDDPSQEVIVEAWSGDVMCAAAKANLFRRDIQDQFGGDGRAGFRLELPTGAVRSHGGEVEVRLQGAVIARVQAPSEEPVLDDMAATARQLSEVRALLEKLEARLPAAESSLAQPLSNYGAYAAAWRDMGLDAVSSSLRTLVVIDAVGAQPRALNDTVRSVLAQTASLQRIAVALVVEKDHVALAEDFRNRSAWQGLGGVSVHAVTSGPPAHRLMAVVGQVGARAEICLFVNAGDELAPGAVRRLAARMDRDASVQALYFDEDCFDEDDQEKDAAWRRRVDPALKPGFDRDMLLQTPYVGRRAAFRMAVVQEMGLSEAAGGYFAAELMLRIDAGGGTIDHVGRVLLSRWPEAAEAASWRQAVEAHVLEEGASITEHDDELGACVSGAVRVRRRVEGARACIIIATKDAGDMLKSCVDSIAAMRAANATPYELLIIDHDSQEAQTQAYLAELEAGGHARIMPYQGEFNWALMNNLAAAQTDAEVLVFLNNDTVVRTRDWLDELVSQAQRPEVGVVGCRLLYDDGTIQHAGFVAREEVYSFLAHEGVGDLGSSSGYMGRHALVHRCVAVTGACIAVRAETFRELGGFDAASFPIEGNDVDLCMRAQAQGLAVLYDPFATLYHLESKSRGFNNDAARRARAEAASRLLWNRWGTQFSCDPAFNPHFDRMSRPFSRLRPPPFGAG